MQEYALKAASFLLLPPQNLSGCLFAAIVRDTRAVALSDQERLSFFPASPLFSATFVVSGEVRLLALGSGVETAFGAAPQPRAFVLPPQASPTVSWSPGPLRAITIGVYPDAWFELAARDDILPLMKQTFAECDELEDSWRKFCSLLSPKWRDCRSDTGLRTSTGVRRLSDWTRAVISRASVSGPGRSVRSLERRLNRWGVGQRKTLAFYEAFQNLHRLSIVAKGASLAELALAAGYADQSHMGRAVRRATGFSPARLNLLIETEESFWCFRLLGERF